MGSKFIVKRLAYSVFVLIGLSILIFTLSRVMPGNPARMALGSRAPVWAVEKLREEMHLNESIYIQYYYWAKSALKGDFGVSLVTRRNVASDIKEFFPASLELALFAGILMGVLGIIFGTVSGWYNNTWIDNSLRVISYIGVVTPSFVFAIFFVLIFSYGLELFPTMGRLSSNITPPPQITRLLTIDALLAGRFDIMFKYLLKPSLIPTVSIYGLDFASLLGNAFLIELIFNWPGLSRYGMNAMLRKDLNAMTATILVFGAVFVLTNIVVDLVVGYLDPRIRLGSERTK